MKRLSVLLVFAATMVLVGCDGSMSPAGQEQAELDMLQERANPAPSPPAESYDEYQDEGQPVMDWSCFWDPTMNENWHDDVLCSNGLDFDRPLLLTDWSFVTQDDMMAEAANYEAYLNGW